MSQVNFVRDLNSMESMMHIIHSEKRLINPRAFLIDSKVDLFKFQNDVKHAVNIWKLLHPLLQSKVLEKIQTDGRVTYAFVKSDCESDVLFMYYQSTNRTTVPWQYLIEYELDRKFDSLNQLLWRMKFVKLHEENKYCLIINLHHALTDGTNAYHIILELLQLIEDVHYNNRRDTSGLDVHQYEYGFPNDPRNGVELPSDYYETANKNQVITDVLVPDCFKPTEEESINECQTDCDGVFVSTGGCVSISVKDVVESRSTHNSRFKIINIDKDLFEKIICKTKDKSVKLTGFLESAFAFALLKLYCQYSIETPGTIKWAVTANIRQFLEPKITKLTMGSGQYNLSFHSELTPKASAIENIWDISKKNSIGLHQFLNSKIYLKKQYALEMEKALFQIQNYYLKKKDVSQHYAITNLGLVTESLRQEKNSKIKVFGYNSFLSSTKTDFFHLAFNSFCTINNRVYWSMSYNSTYLSTNAAQTWIDNIIEILEMVVE